MPSLQAYHAPHRLVADQLRRAPVFAALPTELRECLAVLREGAVFELPAGIEVVSRGDSPALLVVTEGALRDEGGDRDWPAGSCLGVQETAAGRPFSGAIRTAAPTTLYRLDATLLDSFRALCPAIAQTLLNDHVQPTPEPATAAP